MTSGLSSAKARMSALPQACELRGVDSSLDTRIRFQESLLGFAMLCAARESLRMSCTGRTSVKCTLCLLRQVCIASVTSSLAGGAAKFSSPVLKGQIQSDAARLNSATHCTSSERMSRCPHRADVATRISNRSIVSISFDCLQDFCVASWMQES